MEDTNKLEPWEELGEELEREEEELHTLLRAAYAHLALASVSASHKTQKSY